MGDGESLEHDEGTRGVGDGERVARLGDDRRVQNAGAGERAGGDGGGGGGAVLRWRHS